MIPGSAGLSAPVGAAPTNFGSAAAISGAAAMGISGAASAVSGFSELLQALPGGQASGSAKLPSTPSGEMPQATQLVDGAEPTLPAAAPRPAEIPVPAVVALAGAIPEPALALDGAAVTMVDAEPASQIADTAERSLDDEDATAVIADSLSPVAIALPPPPVLTAPIHSIAITDSVFGGETGADVGTLPSVQGSILPTDALMAATDGSGVMTQPLADSGPAVTAPVLTSSAPLPSFAIPSIAPTTALTVPTGAHLSSLSVIDTRQADWPQRLGERIQWTLDGGLREARIELAPDGLGALDLHVQVSGDAVQLHIGAAHAATRELLSEALPRLRELLGDSGLSLGQASVSTSQERTPPRPPPSLWSPSGHGNGEEAASIAPVTRITRGLLDHYA